MQSLEMKLTVYQLDRIIISLLACANNRKYVSNTNKLFGLFSYKSYNTDYEKEVRVYLIKKICKMILEDKLVETEDILNNIDIDGKYSDRAAEILNELYSQTLTAAEVEALDNLISKQLRYGSIDNISQDLIEVLTNIKTENYIDFDEEVKKAETLIGTIGKDLKSAKASIAKQENEIDFSSAGAITRINELIERQASPSNKIKTGIIAFNEMLNGGFEAGRLYCVAGLLKGYKSALLLNSAIWAKKYNHFAPKDPTKQPAVLYITLENSIDDSLLRTFTYSFGNNFKCEDFKNKPAELMRLLQESNIFEPNDTNDTALIYKYAPNNTICADDIDNMIEEYSEAGKEICFIVIDYMKRMVPNINLGSKREYRMVLGDIANDLSDLAKARRVPIFTAMQLNRQALSAIEQESNFANKVLASTKLGASNTGESIDIAQNVDCMIDIQRFVYVDTATDGKDVPLTRTIYLRFHMAASRVPVKDGYDEFIHPLTTNNDLHPVEDYRTDGKGTSQSISSYEIQQFVDRHTVSKNPVVAGKFQPK